MSIKNEFKNIAILKEKGFQTVVNGSVDAIIKQISVECNESYEIVSNDLTPNKEPTNHKKTLSTTYGYNEFPFHTDGAHFLIPPRWVILESTNTIAYKTATVLVDTFEFSNFVPYDNVLNHAIYLVSNGNYSFLTTIINKVLNGKPIFRWNPLLMKLVSKGLTFDLKNVNHTPVRIEWHPKQILIVDNWRMLHSREAVIDEEKLNRELKRYNLTPLDTHASI